MKRDIVHYFLSLYKLQLGVERKAAHHIEPVSSLSDGDSIYELRVRNRGKWAERRMTIGFLGEDSGSKSKCFKVIYDDVLVVKIPPVPINDFDVYISQIRAERRIAEKLSQDIVCIAPGLSAILKKIPSFSGIADASPDKSDTLCIKKLKAFPGFQEYLKIGEGFAFFMDLSEYSFLSNVIFRIHDIGDRLNQEIMNHLDMMGDPFAFEQLYGPEHAAMFFDMDMFFSECDEEITKVLTRYGMLSSVSAYQKKEWCLLHLKGLRVDYRKENLNSEFVSSLNRILSDFFQRHQELIDRYKVVLYEDIHQKAFRQKIAGMSGIITNLLKLTAFLRKTGVAIRDLKPDNVFIVGDLSRSPMFLANPDNYSIGLIDFETSVCFKGDIAQPMLGGTPSYATPSHVFRNDILEQVFGNLRHILHLQDWYALMGIMYKVITGERLFEKTGRLISELVRAAKNSVRQGIAITEVFKQGSQMFWKEALGEFEEHLASRTEMLNSVKVGIPEISREMFRTELLEERADIASLIREHIFSQKMFVSQNSREKLMKSQSRLVGNLRNNWEKGINVPNTRSETRTRIIKFLQGLETLKSKSEQCFSLIATLDSNEPVLNAYTLLEMMFSVVKNAMLPPNWKIAESRRLFFTESHLDDKSLSNEETLAVEKTISYE